MPILKLRFAIYAAPVKGDFASKSLKDALSYESVLVQACQSLLLCFIKGFVIMPEFLVEISTGG